MLDDVWDESGSEVPTSKRIQEILHEGVTEYIDSFISAGEWDLSVVDVAGVLDVVKAEYLHQYMCDLEDDEEYDE